MAEDVIIRYRAEVDDLINKINQVIASQEKLAKGQDKTQTELNQTSASVKKLEAELANTGASFKKAEAGAKGFSSTVKKEVGGAASIITNIGRQIATAFGVVFSVQQVIAFGRASIDAFLAAEENANKLRFAITQINGETEAAFQTLIAQSEKLQKATIFSDDAVQQAQAALATFGLTSRQIEELIPRLADFASATKTDIVSAATQVGAGLQGMGREFKRVGIEVAASQTPLENYQAILQGFEKFAGASAEELETLNGQLKQQANIADELQEDVGEKLAPAWLKVKRAILEATLALLSFSKINQTTVEDLENIGSDAASNVVENARKQGQSNEQIAQSLRELIRLNKEESDALELNLRLRVRSGDFTKAEARAEEEKIALKRGLIQQYEREIQAIEQLNRETDRTLLADQLRGKSLNELNRLLLENKAINNNIAQSNVQLIEEEIKKREKLTKAFLETQQKQLEETKNKVRDWVNDVARLLNDARLKKTIEVNAEFVTDFEKDLKEMNDARLEDAASQQKLQEANFKKRINEEQQLNEIIRQESLRLTQDIGAFYSELLDTRIDLINEELNASLSALTQEEQALQDSRDRRVISEADFAKKQEQIEAKKLEAQKKADKETRKLKRQQLVIDKTIALIEIGLELQKAIAAYSSNPITATLIPLIAGIITAALAAVSAVQIPSFAKGTKGKKGSSMALVGEQGPETVFLPDKAKVLPARQTKVYSEMIDAMYDNRMDKYILKQYVTPRLEAQRKQFQAQKDQTFVQNVVNSMQYNGGLTLSDQLYANSRGVNLRDKHELAALVGKAVAENINRPDPWRM